ncbi:hypothetical protein BpHYR1_039088 [Brachionus plicatilis]|uniref:Uncharacterized protein n=1 Tax=Brachionus plicatilis TaxID=10195 RepID=A0A3M7RZN2_BRAPC|nr:hypothetical protein BpHYR1_039088 [Brachionus plicatilis]
MLMQKFIPEEIRNYSKNKSNMASKRSGSEFSKPGAYTDVYRIPLFSDACFNTMGRIFGAWSNIDLTIPMGYIVDTY